MQFHAQSFFFKSYCLRECGLSKIVVSLLNSSVHTMQATPLEIIRKGNLRRLNSEESFFCSNFTFVSRDLGDEKEKFWRRIRGINLGFWETAHLPLPYANINTYFSFRAKCWLRGGVGGQFPRNLNWSDLSLPSLSISLNKRCALPGGLSGRDLFFVLGLIPLLLFAGTFNRNCLSSGTGPPNNFSSWTAARSLSRVVGFDTPRRSVNKILRPVSPATTIPVGTQVNRF